MDARKEAERQLTLLERGCEEVIPREGLLEKLERSIRTGKPLRVKLGIDPTSGNVHVGHMVPYGKLRQFQDLGHQAVLIIGDYTASIGDPTGRNTERPPLTLAQVKANADSYASQIFRVVDEARAEVRWQSEWYGNLSLAGILKLAGTFSLAQLLAHETFRDRYEKGTRVGIHELFYPILQAYDSVVINADVELGGTDQKFNILAGRDLMRDQEIEPQSAMLLPLLPGLDGRKMSKSFGNDIPVTCGADEMFARVMSIADENIGTYQELVLLESGETGENPMVMKLDLASRITDRFNGSGSGQNARKEWERRFSKKEVPADMPVFTCESSVDICRLLREAGLTASSSEARRLVAEGAVFVNDVRLDDPGYAIDPGEISAEGLCVRIGRRRYVRVLG